jgi:[acyl-carrier-protein] S-malonyltransferase
MAKMDLNTDYALFFPGQGSQAIGMGKELAESSKAAKAVFDEADEALGFSISKMCFEGPEDDLALTANTQPAILTCSIAAFAAARELADLHPKVALGHSLGEFSALVAVGALRFSDAVRLVRLRGQAMQEAVPAGVGAMAAIIGLELDELERLCAQASNADEQVSPANENGGSQVVVAGHAGAVERLSDLAEEADGRAIPLKVSAPFHCGLMTPAAKRLAEALEPVEIGEFSAPVIANVDAEPNVDPARVKGLLVEQVTSRVRWESSVRKAFHMGVHQGLEVGHGKVIRGLVRRIERNLKVFSFGSPAHADVLQDPGA